MDCSKEKWNLKAMCNEALLGKSIMKSLLDIFLERGKGTHRRNWTDDLKDWTDIKTFYTLKRKDEVGEKGRSLVPVFVSKMRQMMI